jgi:hypothetical protein
LESLQNVSLVVAKKRATTRFFATPHVKPFMNMISQKIFFDTFSLIRADGAGEAATSALA